MKRNILAGLFIITGLWAATGNISLREITPNMKPVMKPVMRAALSPTMSPAARQETMKEFRQKQQQQMDAFMQKRHDEHKQVLSEKLNKDAVLKSEQRTMILKLYDDNFTARQKFRQEQQPMSPVTMDAKMTPEKRSEFFKQRMETQRAAYKKFNDDLRLQTSNALKDIQGNYLDDLLID